MNSKPCIDCYNKILEYDFIKTIYFSVDDINIECIKKKSFQTNHKSHFGKLTWKEINKL